MFQLKKINLPQQKNQHQAQGGAVKAEVHGVAATTTSSTTKTAVVVVVVARFKAKSKRELLHMPVCDV